MNEARETVTTRVRLAEMERELGRLQSQHDLAMSAFKFDEASALQRRITSLEGERRVLAAALPPPAPVTETPSGIVPVLLRPRRRFRSRR